MNHYNYDMMVISFIKMLSKYSFTTLKSQQLYIIKVIKAQWLIHSETELYDCKNCKNFGLLKGTNKLAAFL